MTIWEAICLHHFEVIVTSLLHVHKLMLMMCIVTPLIENISMLSTTGKNYEIKQSMESSSIIDNNELVEMNDPQLTKSKATKNGHIKQMLRLQGWPGEGYYLTVLIGTPPQKLRVLIDTGSSNFAVAAYKFSNNTSYFNVSKSTTLNVYNVTVEVPYTQGNWIGNLASDVIKFPPLPNTTNDMLPAIRTKLSLIEHSEKFFIESASWEGIFGLAYPRLAKPFSNILSPFDQYILDGYIEDIFSLQLCSNIKRTLEPLNNNQLSGSLIFGGVENSMYIGEIFYTPIVRHWYYEVILTSITVGNSTLPIHCEKYNQERTIIDSGTTNFRLEQHAFQALVIELKTHQKLGNIPDDFWHGHQYMCWDRNNYPYMYLPTIRLSLLSTLGNYYDFELHITPQMYLREIANNIIDSGQSCYRFAISPSEKGTVIGAVILEGFYVIFDRDSNRIGFAITNCGGDGMRNFQADITGPKLNSYNLYQCHNNAEMDFIGTQLSFIIFTMLVIMMLTSMPLIFYLLYQINAPKDDIL